MSISWRFPDRRPRPPFKAYYTSELGAPKARTLDDLLYLSPEPTQRLDLQYARVEPARADVDGSTLVGQGRALHGYHLQNKPFWDERRILRRAKLIVRTEKGGLIGGSFCASR